MKTNPPKTRNDRIEKDNEKQNRYENFEQKQARWVKIRMMGFSYEEAIVMMGYGKQNGTNAEGLRDFVKLKAQEYKEKKNKATK